MTARYGGWNVTLHLAPGHVEAGHSNYDLQNSGREVAAGQAGTSPKPVLAAALPSRAAFVGPVRSGQSQTLVQHGPAIQQPRVTMDPFGLCSCGVELVKQENFTNPEHVPLYPASSCVAKYNSDGCSPPSLQVELPNVPRHQWPDHDSQCHNVPWGGCLPFQSASTATYTQARISAPTTPQGSATGLEPHRGGPPYRGPPGGGFPGGDGPGGGFPGGRQPRWALLRQWAATKWRWRMAKRGPPPPGPPEDPSDPDGEWNGCPGQGNGYGNLQSPWTWSGQSIYELKMERNIQLRPWPNPWEWQDWLDHLKQELARMVAPYNR